MAVSSLQRIMSQEAQLEKKAERYQSDLCGEKVYRFEGPRGEIELFPTLSAFCRTHFGLNNSGRPKYVSSFSELQHGRRAQDNVRGWKLIA